MKPRKKIEKLSSSEKPKRNSVIPFLVLLFVVVFCITKFTGKNNSKKIDALSHPTISLSKVTSTPNIQPVFAEQNAIANHHPVFSTFILPIAQVNIPYKTILSAEDTDVNDNLTMVVTNLPNGVGYTCNWGPKNNKKTIECTISGIPTFTYSADVIATVKDDTGGTAINRYTFQVIQPTPTLFPSNAPTFTPSPAYIYPTWTPTP